MESNDVQQPADEEITTAEVLENLEFGLWTAVVLIPILYYINGPSVSNDQWYMRAALCVIAYLGAPLTSWVRRRGPGSPTTELPDRRETNLEDATKSPTEAGK